MKEPKINDLKIDEKATRLLRKKMAKTQKVRITINLDQDVLTYIRDLAEEGGSPYQTFLNKLLRDAVSAKRSEIQRLDRLEKELEKIKRRIAA
jgi:predicted DNA binding CopG/RHH family protein